MAFQRHQAGIVGLLEKCRVKVLARQREGHIHPRARRFLDRILVVTRTVDVAVQQFGLGAIARADRDHAALGKQPLEYEAGEIPAEGIRRVQHRLVGRVFGVVENFWNVLRTAREQILAHDHHHQTRSADVLLRPGIDDAEFRDVDGPRQDIRRHIRHQRHLADIGNVLEFDTMDGFVRRVMHVSGFRIEIPRGRRRDRREVAFGAAGGDAHPRQRLGFLCGLFAPMAGDEVIGSLVAARKIHRNLGEMLGRAALQKQHFVALWNIQQRAQIAL